MENTKKELLEAIEKKVELELQRQFEFHTNTLSEVLSEEDIPVEKLKSIVLEFIKKVSPKDLKRVTIVEIKGKD